MPRVLLNHHGPWERRRCRRYSPAARLERSREGVINPAPRDVTPRAQSNCIIVDHGEESGPVVRARRRRRDDLLNRLAVSTRLSTDGTCPIARGKRLRISVDPLLPTERVRGSLLRGPLAPPTRFAIGHGSSPETGDQPRPGYQDVPGADAPLHPIFGSRRGGCVVDHSPDPALDAETIRSDTQAVALWRAPGTAVREAPS